MCLKISKPIYLFTTFQLHARSESTEPTNPEANLESS